MPQSFPVPAVSSVLVDRSAQEAERIIALLTSSFVLPNGALAMKREHGAVLPYHVFCDFGDIAPFLLHFGKTDFVAGQLQILERTLRHGVLVSEFPTLGVRGWVKSYEYTDLLLGLLDVHQTNPELVSRESVERTLQQVIRLFRYDKKFCSWYFYPLRLPVPVRDTRDGMMIELFVDAQRLLGGERYSAIAKSIADQLLTLPWYQKHHLLPTLVTPSTLTDRLLGQKSTQAEIAKHTTNTLYGLLALLQTTGDNIYDTHIEQMLIAVRDTATHDGGGVVKTYRPGQAPKKGFLTSSCFTLDFICDYVQVTGKTEWLAYGQTIADYWISRQSALGLFPEFSDGETSFLDSETDMSVSLAKLYECTGDVRYWQAAERCIGAVITQHGQYDYPLRVSIVDGQPKDTLQKTKFLALFLKAIILLQAYAKGETIYSSPQLHALLRDR
jgi:hypothetical protein